MNEILGPSCGAPFIPRRPFGVPCVVRAATLYEVKCIRKGRLVWEEDFWNIVVTAGLNILLDSTIKSGVSSPAWFVGLKGTGSMISADTMASHSGWAELVPFSNATRPAFVPGSISGGSVDNSASKAVFNITSTSTIYGCFLANNSTLSGTSGTLYGGGDFGTPRGVLNGDVLNVTVTLTQVTG